MVPIIASTSGLQTGEGEVRFDQAGSNYYLSEVVLRGTDGILLPGTPGKHARIVVKAHR